MLGFHPAPERPGAPAGTRKGWRSAGGFAVCCCAVHLSYADVTSSERVQNQTPFTGCSSKSSSKFPSQNQDIHPKTANWASPPAGRLRASGRTEGVAPARSTHSTVPLRGPCTKSPTQPFRQRSSQVDQSFCVCTLLGCNHWEITLQFYLFGVAILSLNRCSFRTAMENEVGKFLSESEEEFIGSSKAQRCHVSPF